MFGAYKNVGNISRQRRRAVSFSFIAAPQQLKVKHNLYRSIKHQRKEFPDQARYDYGKIERSRLLILHISSQRLCVKLYY